MPEGRTRGGQAEDGLRVPSSSALGAAGGAYTCNLDTFAANLFEQRPVGHGVITIDAETDIASTTRTRTRYTQYGPDMAATNQGTPLKDHARAPRSASRARTSARAAT